MKNVMHHSRIGLAQKNRKEIIVILNSTLATLSDLYAQLKQAHWNVKGMEFFSLHTMFDKIAEEIEEQVDIVAERITSLGGTALGTIQQATENTALDPYPVDIFSAKDHLERLAQNFAKTGEHTRTNIDKAEELEDMATSDLYIDLTRVLDLRLWFIEAHLQSKTDIEK